MARTPRPVTRHTREITLTVTTNSTDGMVPEPVLRTLADELVARVGTEANPNCVTVELAVTAELDAGRITITVTVHSIINGVLQEYVMRTLVDELVTRVGTEATANHVTVELAVTGELDVDRRTRGL